VCLQQQQVLGHTKTVLVLLISWLVLGETMTGRKLLGMVLAVAGMVGYGFFNSGKPAPAPEPVAAAGSPAEKKGLLPTARSRVQV
jgi:solute carrier family 35 protein E3